MTVTELPKVVKIKHAEKAGYFGIAAYPKAVATLSCQLSHKGGYNTGLTKEDEAHYEKILELKAGELNKHSKWWGEVFNVKYAIRLSRNKATELFLDDPISQLKYKVLLAHSRVANSETEKLKPGVWFYIDDPETKAKKENESISMAFEGMTLIRDMTPEQKKSALRLFGKTGVNNISESMSSNQLFAEMQRDPKHFLSVMTDKNLEAKAWIKELEEWAILKRKGSTYLYGDDAIAANTEECIKYFEEHQDVKLVVGNLLKSKKK